MPSTYSITEAIANLPHIIAQVESGGPIELTRRGKPVAMVLSRREYDLLSSARTSFTETYGTFLERFSLADVGLEKDFAASLRAGGSGRAVEL